MKFIIVTGFFASAVNGALSTMRLGPRKAIRGHAGFEFGRPVDDVDVDAAFQEMKLIQRRFLQGGTSYGNEAGGSFPIPGLSFPYPGMSLPYPGMSTPFPGMSLPFPGMSTPFPGMSTPFPGMSTPFPGMSTPFPGMSTPFPGMSTPFPGMSLSHSASIYPTVTPSSNIAPKASNTDMPSNPEKPVDCVGRVSTTSTRILVQLDVDAVSNDLSFLDVLAESIVSFGEIHFSLCQTPSNKRLLLEPMSLQEQYNASVTGFDAIATAADAVLSDTPDVCTSVEQGAFCTVVDVVLTVYTADQESSSVAEHQVYDEVLVQQLEAGTYVNGDIIAVRFHPKQAYPNDSSAVSRDGNQEAPIGGAPDSSTVPTIIIVVLVLVAVAVLVGLVYRKRMANNQWGHSEAGSDDDSKSDGSSSAEGDGALLPGTATGHSPNSV
ncbi:hypothetical protein MHU86_6190 [Fragilaria crotonensis]|nr:hypothetical protein MHU86_6190 [Fragilaria crotonensis]